jgi:hypothetical protein
MFLFRNRQDECKCFFSHKNDLVFCNDICSVIEALGHQHCTPEWRLFVDSSKVSLKAVLLHNGNKYSSVPFAHAVNMKESYENTNLILEKIRYDKYKWNICGDLKAIALFLGLQLGYTRY